MPRPAYDRNALLELIARAPRRGRQLRKVNERDLSAALGWNRATVATAISDLKRTGRVQRWRKVGSAGLIVKVPL